MAFCEELGHGLALEPYLEVSVLAAGLLRGISATAFTERLARISRGAEKLVFAWWEPDMPTRFDAAAMTALPCRAGWRLDGRKAVVIAADDADTLLVTARIDGEAPALFLLDAHTAGITRINYPTIDGRMASDLIFESVQVETEGLVADAKAARPLLARIGDVAIAALCAEGIGVMRYMLDATIAYTSDRRQFGQPIATFQTLQHRMVDMFLKIEMAAAATLAATASLVGTAADRAIAVSAAKVMVADACRFVGQNCIQLHGGLGMDSATPVTRYFCRALAIESEFGSAAFHLERVAAA